MWLALDLSLRPRLRSNAAAPTYSAEATALFARMGVQPAAARKTLIDNFCKTLVTAGVWPKLDALHVTAGHDRTAVKLNWVSTSYTLVEFGTCSFVVDAGFTSDTTTGYLDTTANPLSAGIKFTQNSAAMGVYASTDAISAQPLCGNSSARILTHTAANQAQARPNAGTNLVNLALPTDTARGLTAWSRLDATNVAGYKDGANLGNQVLASQALNAFNFLYLAASPLAGGTPTGFSPLQCGGGFFGSQLNDADHATIASAFSTYMTALGPTYSAEATALFARMSVAPTSARKTLIDNAIVALKGYGLWAKLSILYVPAAHDRQAAMLNWVAAGYTLTEAVGPIGWTADRGFKGDAIGQYFSTNWDPVTDGGALYVMNSAHIGLYCGDNITSSTKNDFGAARAFINARNGAAGRISVNSTSLLTVTLPVATAVGHWAASRNNDAANVVTYKNGVSLGLVAEASATLQNSDFYLCAINASGTPSGFCDRLIAAAHAGAPLNDTEMANLWTVLSTYMAGVGAAVS